MAFVQKADSVFKKRLQTALAPVGYDHPLGKFPVQIGERVAMQEESIIIPRHTEYDAGEVEKLFFQYGTYLEMIGGDAPYDGEPIHFEMSVLVQDKTCGLCGRNPAEGLASVEAHGVQVFYCHGDAPREGEAWTCYEIAQSRVTDQRWADVIDFNNEQMRRADELSGLNTYVLPAAQVMRDNGEVPF